MNSEFSPDLVTLSGDDGTKSEFEILDIIEDDESIYYVLSPRYADPAAALNRAFEYYIFEVRDKDGEREFIEIDDDAKAERLCKIFEKRYNDILFGDCD